MISVFLRAMVVTEDAENLTTHHFRLSTPNSHLNTDPQPDPHIRLPHSDWSFFPYI